MEKHAGIRITALLPLFLLTGLVACRNEKKQQAEEIVKAWVGKEIQFPTDAQCVVMGRDTVGTDLFEKPYKVLVYIDSAGCTNCKLRLSEWKKIMLEADSIAPDKVGFLFYFNPKNERELLFMFKQERMNYPVFIDKNNRIQDLNHFPDNMMYQSFLLDKNNKVLLVGNPTMSPPVWNLYKEQITGQKFEKKISVTSASPEIQDKKLSGLQVGQTTKTEFTIQNTGKEALIISEVKTSCGCTVPRWDKEPVKPGKEMKIQVEIKPETAGHFHKTIDVYCNIQEKSIQLTITGMVE